MARPRWTAPTVVVVGVLGWLPAIVLIWHFAPPVWAWAISHPGTVCAVLAVLLLVLAVSGPPTSGNRGNPPPR